ncbi:MAG: hypothetical protein J1G01_05055 [Clostridiales bacterium]|nr:hypothetical protein [Clostridiales bacterium]
MGKLSGFISRLKNIKHIEVIACGAVLVVVLLIYFSCVSCSGSKDSELTAVNVDLSKTDYCTAMQIQVEKIVSEISGVGSASVVINWDRSVSASFGGSSSENPRAVGALIVCDGGNNTKVKLDVMYAVSTLLDLSIERIMVYPKSK